MILAPDKCEDCRFWVVTRMVEVRLPDTQWPVGGWCSLRHYEENRAFGRCDAGVRKDELL